MNNIRGRIAMAVLQHRVIASLLFLAVTLFFAAGLKNVRLETIFSDLLPKDDPFIHVFKDHPNFGNPLTFTLMVKNKNGDIYNPETLAKENRRENHHKHLFHKHFLACRKLTGKGSGTRITDL